jgi:hypothetical protein
VLMWRVIMYDLLRIATSHVSVADSRSIDWAGVDTEQLYRKLNGADMVRDSLVREIENRRQKVA